MATPPVRRKHQQGLESFIVVGKTDSFTGGTLSSLKQPVEYQLAVRLVEKNGGLTTVVSVDADIYNSANPGERIELPTYSFDRGRTRYLSLRDAAKFTSYFRDENVKDEGGEG